MKPRYSAFAVALIAGPVLAADFAGERSELAERCEKLAAAWFKGEWGNGIVSTTTERATASYRSHYNAKLNNCLMLITADWTAGSILDPTVRPRHSESLFAVAGDEKQPKGGKTYANYVEELDTHSVFWNVGDKTGDTKDEWIALTKAYMED